VGEHLQLEKSLRLLLFKAQGVKGRTKKKALTLPT